MLELAMVSGPLPLAIWRSSFLTGDGFLVGEALALALVGERRRSIAPGESVPGSFIWPIGHHPTERKHAANDPDQRHKYPNS